MIGIIIVASAFFLGIYLAIRDAKNWDRLVEEAGKQAREKRKEIIFVEEEELGAEHAGLVASDAEEEEEALYWS